MAKKIIKAQMQQRRDTKANWAATNPVLLDGELGIVSDDPNLYKVGDGATAWNSLPFRGFDGTLAQELGTSPNSVISQKVVSEEIKKVSDTTDKLDITLNGYSTSADFTNIEGKNIYSCPVQIPAGALIKVSFSASSTIQCVMGVTFSDGTSQQEIGTLYSPDQTVEYAGAKSIKKVNLYIATSGVIEEFSIHVEAQNMLPLLRSSLINFDKARATGVFYATLGLDILNGECTVRFTRTSSSSGYIYHDRGYIILKKDINKTFTFTTGIVYIYADAQTSTINLSQDYQSIPLDAVILEAFYSYGGGYTMAIWSSPFIAKAYTSPPDRYCTYSNPAVISKLSDSLDSLEGFVLGTTYNKNFVNVEAATTYSCASPVKKGELMEVWFESTKTDMQCVMGVYFTDGSSHFQIATLYGSGTVARYTAEQDVARTALYIASAEGASDFTIYIKVSGVAEKIGKLEQYSAKTKPVSVKIFQRVGCIGDSYTAGYISTSKGLLNSSPNNAWPHYLEGLTNNHFDNWGVSGSTAKGWILGAANLAKVKEAGNKCQAYMIGLMINDRSNASWNSYYTPVGKKDDIGTDADSYYGYYYKLVQEVAKVNPDAKIFCNTCPKWPENDEYNQAVRDIVVHAKTAGLNVYLLDLAGSKYSELYQDPTFAADAINGHYTAIGYEYMAECYMRVISDVINDNIAEFQDVAYIPFDPISE